MKRFFTFCFLILFINCYSQIETYKEFEKYSYLVYQKGTTHIIPLLQDSANVNSRINYTPFNNITIGQNVLRVSTGYFLRYKKRLFFIGSYHATTGNNLYDTLNPKYPDNNLYSFMAIRYNTKDGEQALYPLPLDSILENSPTHYFIEYPDIFVLEIKNMPSNAVINSVETYLPHNKKITLSSADTAFLYGFSGGDKLLSQVSFENMPIFFQTEFWKSTSISSKNFSRIESNIDSLYYIFTPGSEVGVSGAPVFLKRATTKRNRFELVGVQAAKSNIYPLGYVVKLSEILKKVKEDIKK